MKTPEPQRKSAKLGVNSKLPLAHYVFWLLAKNEIDQKTDPELTEILKQEFPDLPKSATIQFYRYRMNNGNLMRNPQEVGYDSHIQSHRFYPKKEENHDSSSSIEPN